MAALTATARKVTVTSNHGRRDRQAKPLRGNVMIADAAIIMAKKGARRHHGLLVGVAIIMAAMVNRVADTEEPLAAAPAVLLPGNDEMDLRLPTHSKTTAMVVTQARDTANLQVAMDSPTWVRLQA